MSEDKQESRNLGLWNRVCKTDPKHTKKAKIGAMSITAICPQAQRMNATEVFGPFGRGWGVNEDANSYSFLDFSDGSKLCTYRAQLWYRIGNEVNEFPITGNIKAAFVTQGGKGYLKVDDEYSKKVSTDALTKGLSMLGFNADIFLGKFDDNKYGNQMKAEFKEEIVAKPVDKAKAQALIDEIEKCTDIARLREIWADVNTTPDIKTKVEAKVKLLTDPNKQ